MHIFVAASWEKLHRHLFLSYSAEEQIINRAYIFLYFDDLFYSHLSSCLFFFSLSVFAFKERTFTLFPLVQRVINEQCCMIFLIIHSTVFFITLHSSFVFLSSAVHSIAFTVLKWTFLVSFPFLFIYHRHYHQLAPFHFLLLLLSSASFYYFFLLSPSYYSNLLPPASSSDPFSLLLPLVSSICFLLLLLPSLSFLLLKPSASSCFFVRPLPSST